MGNTLEMRVLNLKELSINKNNKKATRNIRKG